MKKLLFGLGLVGLISLSAWAFAKLTEKSPVEKAQEFTVIVTNEALGQSARGTGILLDSEHVLTCAHMVMRTEDTFLVYTYPLGRVVRAHLEGTSKQKDVAILVLESTVTVHELPIFEPNVTIGEPITVIGNALGSMQWFVTRGVVSGMDRDMLVTDALINPGNSGGPWINDKGHIVAMTSWRIGPEEHIPGMSGGVSAKTILEILQMRSAQAAQVELMQILMGTR